jgi:hypothetical protein
MSKPNKQTAVSVTNAEQLLARFERERADLVERRASIAEKRRSVAYDAHAGDGSSSKLLDGLHREAAELENRITGLDDAIAEAKRRLEANRADEAKAADRAKAVELRAALKQFVQHGAGVDAALEVLIESCNGMQEALTAMHHCGSSFPSDAQLLSLGGRVLLGALSKTPFRRNFETLPPLERNRTMTAVVQQWSDTVERSIAQRLGDEQTNKTEAA